MSNKDNAPFYVGQMVVCVRSGKTIGKEFCVEKDLFYTISRIIFSLDTGMLIKTEETGPAMWIPDRFAPIEPRHNDVEIDESIIEQAQELINTPERVAPAPAIAHKPSTIN